MSDKPIKSVRRVFEILQLFESRRKPLTAKEIADQLDYPLASSHALMKSIHELGFADFDSTKWSYLPSRKFMVLSEWLREYLDRETNLLDCMEELNVTTKETVNLSKLAGADAKIVRGLECNHPIGVSVKVGTLMPACTSLTGLTLLSSLSSRQFDAFISQNSATLSKQQVKELEKQVNDISLEITEEGSVFRADFFVQGIGAVCTPVRTLHTGEPMVIGIVGPSDRIIQNETKHRRTINRLLKKFDIEH